MKALPLTLAAFLLFSSGCSSSGETTAATAGTDQNQSRAEEHEQTPSAPPAGGYGSMAGEEGGNTIVERPESDTQIAELRAALAANPTDDAAERRLAMALLESSQKEEAVQIFEKRMERRTDLTTLLDLALAYNYVSRLADAERTYGRLLEMSPNHHIALHNLGNIAVKRGDHEHAIELYRRALTIKPDYMMAYFHLADALKQLNRFEEAYRTFERVLMLEPTNAQELEVYDNALYQLASIDLNMGATERAIEMLQALIRANPRHAKAHYALGQAFLMSGKQAEAQREFDIHLQIQSTLKPSGAMASAE